MHFAMENSSLHFESYVPNKRDYNRGFVKCTTYNQLEESLRYINTSDLTQYLVGNCYGKMYRQHCVSLHIVKSQSTKPEIHCLVQTRPNFQPLEAYPRLYNLTLKVFTPTFRPVVTLKSSSSCSLRVRCVPCSLVLKVELVPPSLLRSSNVPSSFWSVFQCLSWQSMSDHPLYVL